MVIVVLVKTFAVSLVEKEDVPNDEATLEGFHPAADEKEC
jgi:hypothetical protein